MKKIGILYSIFLVLFPAILLAQQKPSLPTDINPEQDSTNILVKNADNFIRDATTLPAIQYLRGDVRMFQDSIFMYCDSARLQSNSLVAIGNVVILHQDSVKVFADSLIYDGDLRLAELYSNVVLENGDQKLFSNELLYDLKLEIATYQDTALMLNDRAQISSIRGSYDAPAKQAKFIDEVVIVDSVFTMQADSLLYDTERDIATFISHTIIDREDQHIECNSGYYDLKNEKALFGNQATFRDSTSNALANEIRYNGKSSEIILEGQAEYFSDGDYAKADKMTFNDVQNDILLEGNAFYRGKTQTVVGDRIRYNKETEDIDVEGKGKVESESLNIVAKKLNYDSETSRGEAVGEVVWLDTIEQYQIDSEYIEYNDSTNYIKAKKKNDVRPLLTKKMDKDSIFISSDTLVFSKTVAVIDTMNTLDTINAFEAIENVKIIFDKISAICGHLDYNDQDSVFILSDQPVIWSDTTQFFADTVYIHMVDDAIDRMVLKDNGMMITKVVADYYNQISGRSFEAFFDSTEIKVMDVKGSSRALYYLQDDEDAFIGMNKTDCSSMRFYFKDSDLDKISFYEDPTSALTPMKRVTSSDYYLDGFSWHMELRPIDVIDLLDNRILRRGGNPISGGTPSDVPIGKSQEKSLKNKVKIDSIFLFSKAGSPWIVEKDLTILEEQTFKIEAGAEVIIRDGINILAFGDVYIEGTKEDPVVIKGKSKLPGWGQLQVKGSARNFVITHAIIEDGTVTSYDSKNEFSNVQFVNEQDLNWEWAISRFWYGTVNIDSCSMEGPNKVEGFILHDVNNAIIKNSYFKKIPDAIELLKCNNCQIDNNVMRNCSDDAIDLNACKDIIISNNDIKGVQNAGMEIGSEGLGRSTGIQVTGNRIEDCEIGVYLKESSEAVFQLDSIYSCKRAFDISSPVDSLNVSNALIQQCFFENNLEKIVKDERVIVKIEE